MKHDLHSLPLSNSFAALGETFFSPVSPTPFEQTARLLHFNADAADLLDLDHQVQHAPEFAEVFTGKRRLTGDAPLAMLYAGHQFGHFVPQLGDGRAVMLGETTNQHGDKWEIQLKGSGQTPYSRAGDGRAVLRSTIREYLCSEAMHGLGIPTTRALCITGSDDEVYRERIETGAMLTRLAPSHVRFGSFEVFYYREQHEPICTLADYVIEHHYPELVGREDQYLALLQTVITRTARLLAQWQAVGFAHGVMNTDNMSILGLTLDYGPYGFMEAYEPGYICNHSDHEGRYAFKNQPQIGLFNVSCLAQALLPLIEVEAAKAALEDYQPAYIEHFHQLMASKLGFEQADADNESLCKSLLEQMKQSRTDYTTVFRQLAYINDEGNDCHAELRDLFIDREKFTQWLSAYRAQLQQQGKAESLRREAMLACNPKYVLRNYMAQVAIEKAERDQDYSEIDALMTLLKTPFDEHPAHAHYAEPPPDWAGDIEVSCSS
ncbi:protein adenylyltransferase SelO [Sulfuriflexus mobilis]|uniref:protein adenylyltransferase SelO n=1 Tax=Sulfuriflexus mobilis TaxID=1811807 RepID=UPI000F816AF8|nr:YdiU family protein [Sulfuriflexus mobilis]